jgi:hypothetical protein
MDHRVFSGAAMSQASIRPRVAIPAVTIALAVIVWRLLPSSRTTPAIPPPHRATRPIEPSWDSERVAIPVTVDPILGQKELLRPRTSNLPISQIDTDEETPFLEVQHLDNGQLHVVSGTTNGFSGEKVELRFVPRESGVVAAEATVDNFYDFGPPFAHFWKDLKGDVKLSANTWRHGDVVLVDFDLEGLLEGHVHATQGHLRVAVP